MAYCRNCGSELGEDDKFCKECGENQDVKVVEKVVVEKTPEKPPVGAVWFIIGILIPLVGIIAGLIFASQNRKNAGVLILVSILVWGIIFFIAISSLIVYNAYVTPSSLNTAQDINNARAGPLQMILTILRAG
jgi:uncharacterized membrane protein YvbJ